MPGRVRVRLGDAARRRRLVRGRRRVPRSSADDANGIGRGTGAGPALPGTARPGPFGPARFPCIHVGLGWPGRAQPMVPFPSYSLNMDETGSGWKVKCENAIILLT